MRRREGGAWSGHEGSPGGAEGAVIHPPYFTLRSFTLPAPDFTVVSSIPHSSPPAHALESA
ncbi:hypothetical protein E2C01_019736 [Portunus trituberculatus]|uniref:Uncharacterized protein n=1 Tax=Portunus trituberculatus TaxID=210409 RepID=A0A5B7E073_PORTR|nr:hypothetical protein [Portunus trituberculatus]